MISILGDVEAMTKLGQRIRALRLQRNISQSQVAGVVGVTLPTYRKIEAGRGTVEFRHVAKTLGYFGYVEALGDLVPDSGALMSLKESIGTPERKYSSRKR